MVSFPITRCAVHLINQGIDTRNSHLDLVPASRLLLVLQEIGCCLLQGVGQPSIDLLTFPAILVTLLVPGDARVQSLALLVEIRAVLHLCAPLQNHPGQLLQELAQGLSGLRPPVGIVSVVYGVEGAEVPEAEGVPVGIVHLERIKDRPLLWG